MNIQSCPRLLAILVNTDHQIQIMSVPLEVVKGKKLTSLHKNRRQFFSNVSFPKTMEKNVRFFLLFLEMVEKIIFFYSGKKYFYLSRSHLHHRSLGIVPFDKNIEQSQTFVYAVFIIFRCGFYLTLSWCYRYIDNLYFKSVIILRSIHDPITVDE